MSQTPAQLTLAYMKKHGFTCAITERWNAFAKVRQDLFGGIDIVAIRKGVTGVTGIQCTTKHNMVERIKKIVALPQMRTWLEANNYLFVIGWYQETKGGRWMFSRVELRLNEEHQPYAANYTDSESENEETPMVLEVLPKAELSLGASSGDSAVVTDVIDTVGSESNSSVSN